MTTNLSSTNAFKYTYKSGLKGLPILPAIANFGIISFFTLFFSAIELFSKTEVTDNAGNVEGYVFANENLITLFFEDAKYMLPICLVLIAAASLAMAICSFNFITSKKQVNVFYSLGITRTKLFLGKYLSGATLLAATTFLPLFILLILNLAMLDFSGIIFKTFFLYFFSFLVVSLASFTITATIFSCVGTIFEAGIFSSIILFLPDIFLYGIQAIMGKFLYGNPYGFNFTNANNDYYDSNNTAALSETFDFISPIFFGRNELSKFGSIKKDTSLEEGVKQVIENPSFTNIILWVIFTGLILLLGIKLFNKRKAEIAGFIGTNRILNTLVSVLAGFFAYSLAISFTDTLALGITLGIIAFSILHLGLELAVLRDLKKFTRGLYKLPIGVVAITALILLMNSGLFGFSQKIPSYEKIKSASITLVGDTSQYALFGEGEGYRIETDLTLLSSQRVLSGELTSEKDIKAVLKAHELLTKATEDERTLGNTIQITYTLKDGSTFKRNFESVSPEAYRAALYVEDGDFFKNQLNVLFNGEMKKPDKSSYHSSPELALLEAQYNLRSPQGTIAVYPKYLDAQGNLTLSEKDREKLLKALYNDLINRSVSEKYYPDESPLAFLRFESDFYASEYYPYNDLTEEQIKLLKVKPKTKWEFSDYSSDQGIDVFYSSVWNPHPFVAITSDMTETIKFLKDIKIYDELTKTPDFVSAEIMPSSLCYEAIENEAPYNRDMLQYSSRYFLTAYTASDYKALDEMGNPIIDPYKRYSKGIDEVVNGYVTSDQKDVDVLLRYAYTAYEQDSTDTGYFVTFYTSTGDTSLCFIPENKLPQKFKIKF